MMPLRATLPFAFLLLTTCLSLNAQPLSGYEIVSGNFIYQIETRQAAFTNGVVIKHLDTGTVLTADSAEINSISGEAIANGRVRIQKGGQVWAGEHIRYNFKTGQMESQQFRTGEPPVFAAGQGLHAEGLLGERADEVYTATNAFVTIDDVDQPAIRIRAKRIRMVPGERIEATHAVLFLGPVPVFYFPHYSRTLDARANQFNFTPGYRSRHGPFLLGSYTWFLNDDLDGEVHVDYRQKRGVGAGPDLNFHLGRWGEGTIRYYYAHDDDPDAEFAVAPVYENRHYAHLSYLGRPFTGLTLKSLARYQSDIGVVHDFFERDYRQNPQPDTYVEVNRAWRNFSLDVLAQPRINEFYETVERLPDVRFTAFRQQIGSSPLFYESQSSAGYYRRLFAETNMAPPGLDFEAARADTYHEITLPQTLFGWLNVTPRAGGRFTWYSRARGSGAATEELYRGVFNTGAEVSFKASRLWAGAESRLLDVDGLRHIVEPSANYVYVPTPNRRPAELPQFDYELPSLRLLPIEFPEYNAIDSIDSRNVVRFGLRNRLQTKRENGIEDVVDWQILADWRLRPRSAQGTFGDIYSDLSFAPRSWLALESQTRFDLNHSQWRMSLHTVTFRPNDVWSWTVGHFYLRDDFRSVPTALGMGNNVFTSAMFYRLSENWGFRAAHHFDAREGRLQEQYYTVYRDMRSWTAALSAGLRDNGIGSEDIIVSFTFSVKARPRFHLGSDTVRPHSLLGR